MVVKVSESSANASAGVWVSDILASEGSSVEELLKTAIIEGSQECRADFVLSKPAKDVQFSISIDQMTDLGTVDPQKERPNICRHN